MVKWINRWSPIAFAWLSGAFVDLAASSNDHNHALHYGMGAMFLLLAIQRIFILCQSRGPAYRETYVPEVPQLGAKQGL